MWKKVLIVIAILAIAAVPSVYFYLKYQKTQRLLKNPTEAAAEEKKDILGKVGAILELPKNEEPTVATVNDKEKLKDQPFFANAQNGDSLIVYANAKKAILYRPSTNRIIDMASVSLPATNTASASGSKTLQGLKVAIYNGTSTPRLANSVEKSLTDKYSYMAVVKKDNAAKNDYPKTVVVDLSGSKADEAQIVAQHLGATVEQLPAGEAKPEADILVIIGADHITPVPAQ